ncbi:MAG: PilW family protein [gamma proteobacterium symbiont of Taylorina sp.]|nr:PilW family protein [gamma proteobacterium symbiont of Taylorina sp.]
MLNNSKKQSGLTLVELMIALVISLIVIAGVIEIYLSNKRTYNTQAALSQIQEDGRFASIFIKKDLRMSGYMGCMGRSIQFKNNVDSSQYSDELIAAANLNLTSSVKGFNNGAVQGFNDVTVLPDILTNMGLSIGTAQGQMITNTDIVLVRFAGFCSGGNVVAPLMGDKAANIKIADAGCSGGCCINKNDLVIITDCKNADLFAVVNNASAGGGSQDTLTHSSALNSSNTLSVKYGLDARVYKYQATVWYIGNGAYGRPALFKKSIQGNNFNSVEVVEGIENMQLVFGQDSLSNGSVDSYVNADTLPGTNNIVSIKVSFLVSSLKDNVASEPVALNYNGVTINSGAGSDKRLRRVFNSTIALRNHLK